MVKPPKPIIPDARRRKNSSPPSRNVAPKKPIDALLDRLEGVTPTSRGHMACCPAHGDSKPSLSVGTGDDGRILLKCFAGCETADIVEALGLTMADLYPPNGHHRASTNGRASRGSSERRSAFDQLFGDRRLAAAWDRAKGEPAVGVVDPKPLPDVNEDERAVAKVLGFLQNRTPQRDALLEAAGLKGDALSPRLLAALSRGVLRHVEGEEASLWKSLPHGDREDGPRRVGLNTVRLSEVAPTEVDWLWPKRIPAGKLTLISGNPNAGKTWLALDLIARVTTGRAFADGTRLKKRYHALWISAEDADDDTIRPRLDTLKGDPSRVHSLRFVLDDRKSVSLALDRHLDYLDTWLSRHPQVKVVAFDPITACLGGIDSHKNADVRGVLAPLSRLAEKHGVAIVGINHLTKDGAGAAIYRSLGSVGIVAAARAAWQVTLDPSNPNRRLFLPVKQNLAASEGGLAFSVSDAGVKWETREVKMTADQALAEPKPRDIAKRWLLERLADGPVSARDIAKGAEEEGINERTLKNAKKELGVKSRRKGDEWFWVPAKK